MDLLDRPSGQHKLNCTCESVWTCGRLPRTRQIEREHLEMSRPRPDPAVAFNSASLISRYDMNDLGDLKGRMCLEESGQEADGRAFHFFSMEV